MYASYVTTPEEYLVQRYEGASTIFGPNTLPIYTVIYEGLLQAIFKVFGYIYLLRNKIK